MYPKMISPFNIGQSLRMAQKLTGMTNGDVAKNTGVGPIQVSRWRQWSDMKYSRVNQLADLFNMSVEDFVKLGGYSVQEPMTDKAMQRLQDIVPVEVEVVAHASGMAETVTLAEPQVSQEASQENPDTPYDPYRMDG